MPTSQVCSQIDSCVLLNLVKELLHPVLGKYTYSNGFVTSSIAIGSTPEDIVCEGLEIIVPLLPDVINSEVTSTNIVEKLKWKILVYDRGKGSQLKQALSLLKTLSASSTYIFIPKSDRIPYPVLVFNAIHYQSAFT